MKKEIDLELIELGVNDLNKKLFEFYWDNLYDALLTKYGISSNEADNQLELYYNQLN